MKGRLLILCRCAILADFYELLPPHPEFNDLADDAIYSDLPSDWWVGTTDIVDSSAEIAAGRYKTVNMVGAAVISAVMNAIDRRPFPYVFGGDGAGFAVAPDCADVARQAIAAVRTWALAEYNIRLRGALVPVADVSAAGHRVTVARFQASRAANYAMFSGGGMAWVEQQMKRGVLDVPAAPKGTWPDLSGLSCRWAHMTSRNGTILSLVIIPSADADPALVAETMRGVLSLTEPLERGGHPVPAEGPGTGWQPGSADIEAHVARAGGSLQKAKRQVVLETLLAWVFLKTNIKLGGFDPRTYRREVGENADFRKFDDGLKMTIDCDVDTRRRLEAFLDAAQEAGILRYGIWAQDQAMMTCIVPSALSDDHVHFVDGAGGGYTQAALQLKG